MMEKGNRSSDCEERSSEDVQIRQERHRSEEMCDGQTTKMGENLMTENEDGNFSTMESKDLGNRQLDDVGKVMEKFRFLQVISIYNYSLT